MAPKLGDPLGKACLAPLSIDRDILVADVVRARITHQWVDRGFLCYQINADNVLGQFKDQTKGTTRPRVNLTKVRCLRARLCPQPEQTRIVEKLEELLSSLDAGVAELKAAQKKLAQYRQLLLKAAVEGALTAKWRAKHQPTETGAQLLDRILTERRTRWEAKQLAKFEEQGKTPPKDWQGKYPEPVPPDTTGLPELPQGWGWASLNQLLCDLRSGSAETSGRGQTDYPVLKSSAVRQAAIDFEALNYLRQDQCRDENYLEIGDFLVTRLSGSVEYVGCSAIVLSVPAGGVQYPDRIFCGRILPSMPWLGDFLVCCFRSGYARSRIEVAAKSTAGHKRISMSDLHPFPIPLPPTDEAQAVLQRTTESLKQVEDGEVAVVRALRQATAQRQNILKAAFSGQLVPQDPNDEPASVLLDRIRAESVVRASSRNNKHSAARTGRKPKC